MTPAAPVVTLPAGGLDQPARQVLLLLHRARAAGVQRLSEVALRKRLAKVAAAPAGVGGGTLALIDSMIARGVVERQENLDRQGNVQNSFLTVTPAGETLLESLFGPITREPLAELAQRIQGYLDSCRRPEIAAMLGRQLDLVRSGQVPSLDAGETGPLAFMPRTEGSAYEKIIEFFGFIGGRPAGEVWDFKEVSGRLHSGIKDSVKHLDSLRYRIATIAEIETGLSLEEMGVSGAHLLYWVPFHGDLCPDGASLWGSVPALSTRDIRRVKQFRTQAKTLMLVENRTALDYLADAGVGSRGWLVICTDGMPKHGMFEMLVRLDHLESMEVLTWTDWDAGGLRITENILKRLPAGLGSVVPHPLLHGRKVDVSPAYLSHSDPRMRSMAESISEYGEVYQEESLSLLNAGAGFLTLP